MAPQPPPDRDYSYQQGHCAKHQQHKEKLHEHQARIPNLTGDLWKIYMATGKDLGRKLVPKRSEEPKLWQFWQLCNFGNLRIQTPTGNGFV
jgi:hypothetical protein